MTPVDEVRAGELPGGRGLYGAVFVNSVAEFSAWITVLVVAFEQGGSAAAGLAVTAQLVPAALLAPIVAAAGDRFARHRVLGASFATQAAAACGMAIAAVTGSPLGLLSVFAAIFIVATISVPATVASLLVHHARTPTQLMQWNVRKRSSGRSEACPDYCSWRSFSRSANRRPSSVDLPSSAQRRRCSPTTDARTTGPSRRTSVGAAGCCGRRRGRPWPRVLLDHVRHSRGAGRDRGEVVLLLTAPASFGEIALLRDALRTATVTPTTPCEMAVIGQDDFLDAISRTGASHRGALAIAGQHRRSAEPS